MKRRVARNREKYLHCRTSGRALQNARLTKPRNKTGRGHSLDRQLVILNQRMVDYWYQYQKAIRKNDLKKMRKYKRILDLIQQRCMTIALKLAEKGKITYEQAEQYYNTMTDPRYRIDKTGKPYEVRFD